MRLDSACGGTGRRRSRSGRRLVARRAGLGRYRAAIARIATIVRAASAVVAAVAVAVTVAAVAAATRTAAATVPCLSGVFARHQRDPGDRQEQSHRHSKHPVHGNTLSQKKLESGNDVASPAARCKPSPQAPSRRASLPARRDQTLPFIGSPKTGRARGIGSGHASHVPYRRDSAAGRICNAARPRRAAGGAGCRVSVRKPARYSGTHRAEAPGKRWANGGTPRPRMAPCGNSV